MKIKAKWGFIGNALLLGAQSSKVTAGQTFDNVDEEYGHTLVGKGLAEQASDEAKPRTSRQTAPRTARPAGPEVTKPTATAEATRPT